MSARRRTTEARSGPLDLLTEDELLVRVHDHADVRARELMLERGMPLVHHIAQRYDRRGITYEELVQVGSIGLIKAVDRFEPARGLRFSTFAVPTITGEIRRHFRDHAWAVRVTRSLQESAALVNHVTEQLAVELQRSPTVQEIAAASRLGVDEVLQALEAARHYSVESLDAPLSIDGDSGVRGDLVGSHEHGYEEVEARLLIDAGLRCLQARERRILQQRFGGDMIQAEIAVELGLSQMHVSRLLAQALDTVREHLAPASGPAGPLESATTAADPGEGSAR